MAGVEARGSDISQEAGQSLLVSQGPEASPDQREGHGSPPRRSRTGAVTVPPSCLWRVSSEAAVRGHFITDSLL